MNARLCLLALTGLTLALGAAGLADDSKAPAGRTPPPNDDLALVERVIEARKRYKEALEQLREQYIKMGDVERQRWVEEELISFHRISKRAYRLDLDVPAPTLQPQYNDPGANELFRRAMAYKGKGFWGQEHDDNLRRAEILFQQLLSTYPQSDKIDDAAFQLGEIYESRVFKQYRRAAMYYQRCFEWNPNTDSEARLRCARLYDKVLQDRGRAIQLYRDVMNHDADQKRVDEAKKRLSELSASPP
jgi:tetratricopeptide (TPR) repeat protein